MDRWDHDDSRKKPEGVAHYPFETTVLIGKNYLIKKP